MVSFTVGAALILALAVAAALQVKSAVEFEMQQRIDGIVAHDVGVAAVAAIATIRAAAAADT